MENRYSIKITNNSDKALTDVPVFNKLNGYSENTSPCSFIVFNQSDSIERIFENNFSYDLSDFNTTSHAIKDFKITSDLVNNRCGQIYILWNKLGQQTLVVPYCLFNDDLVHDFSPKSIYHDAERHILADIVLQRIEPKSSLIVNLTICDI